MRAQPTRSSVANVPGLRPVKDSGGPSEDLLEVFAGYLLALGLAPRTVAAYERALERFLVHAIDEGFDPMEANVFDLSGYAQTLPNTSTSKRQHRVALAALVRMARPP